MAAMNTTLSTLALSLTIAASGGADGLPPVRPLAVSGNRRFLQTSDGKPFFWLGDTAWLLFQKLDRPAAERYLEDRRGKGFNVIQCMALHTGADKNFQGMPALTGGDPARPNVTPGNNPAKAGEYDYWDHVDWVVDRAAGKGIYIAMVAAWGSLAQKGILNTGNAASYGRFLAERYKNKPNVIWLNGGDTRGDRNTEVWQTLGRTLKEFDPGHLATYHPFGRTQSSVWFHDQPWLDFNMFQSGHRRYDQDTEPGAKGEDNWRYAVEDYARTPAKPTIDAEPSYEGIPQGLHDPKQPRWGDKDCRRYAYWAVFAGAFGHTYGHAAVMQMHKGGSAGSYGTTAVWWDAIHDPGAGQMQHLKKLILSRPYFERVPDQTLAAGQNGTRYDYVIGTRGESYAFVYTYTGRPFRVAMGKISGRTVRASWFDPSSGESREIGNFPNTGTRDFTPPGTPAAGNDRVLVLDDASRKYAAPGVPR
jgi:hypothetical protein